MKFIMFWEEVFRFSHPSTTDTILLQMGLKKGSHAAVCLLVLITALSCVTPPEAPERGETETGASADSVEAFRFNVYKKILEDRVVPPDWEQFLFERAVEKQALSLLSGMTLAEKIGQLFFISLWNPGKSVYADETDDWVKKQLDALKPGGIILFGGNIDTEKQTRNLVRDLQRASRVPLFIATDQEGGNVSRLLESKKINAAPIPSPKEIGELNNTDLTMLAGWVTGRELASLGINMDFAPLADVLTNEGNKVIGTRSFGPDFKVVADHSSAFARGLKAAGVTAVIKHFPGHGSSAGDPHVESVRVEETLDTLRSTSFLPFKRAVEEGIECVMTAHISLPEITGTDYPASCSRYVNLSLLRGELGFDGVIITDSLAMGAVSARWESGEGALRALSAGADLLLMPKSPRDAYAAAAGAVVRGRIEEARIDQSVLRILETKIRRGIIPLSSGPVASRGTAKNLEEAEKRIQQILNHYLPEFDLEETENDPDSGKIIGSRLHKLIADLLRKRIEDAAFDN